MEKREGVIEKGRASTRRVGEARRVRERLRAREKRRNITNEQRKKEQDRVRVKR